ncbi:MAG: hypothetical protein K6B43_09005 [Treponema sp.]|nr:hypothetical protein [Treponema sp.]
MTKIFAGFAALVFTAELGFVSCSNDDEDDSVNISIASQSLEDAAYSVIRSLCDLTQYDSNAVQSEDKEDYIGVETLPAEWKSMKFVCDQGVVLDDTKPTVYSIAVNNTADAKEFFSSMIGESVEDDSYTWTCDGLGSLSFSAVTGDEDLFATLSVNISVLPGVTEIRFVPIDVIDEAKAENASSFIVPYYDAGDVIKRVKDNTYWICVRPAGGAMKKDKSYWICLNPGNIIESEKKTYSNLKYNGQTYSQTWTYAKKLMSLKTAKAAYHTFALITGTKEGSYIYNYMKQQLGDDIAKLGFESDGYLKFCFAYDGPKNDSARAGVKLAQPFISGYTHYADSSVATEWGWDKLATEYIYVHFSTGYASQNNITNERYPQFLFSLTDDYDAAHLLKNFDLDLVDLDFTVAFDYKNYLQTYSPSTGFGFNTSEKYLEDVLNYRVIISPELVIKDNKGNAEIAKRPVKDKDYEDVCTLDYVEGSSYEPLDWWDSLGVTVRYVDGNWVEWDKENK